MSDRSYLRISLATAESGSIAKQRAQIARHASRPVEYVDESVSGSKIRFADRPAGRRLLAGLQPGDRVLVTRIDRAARNVRDLLDLVETIEDRGATIRFTEQDIDTSGPMGRFLLTLLAAIAELEAGIISERRVETLAVMRSEGRHAAGGIPLGLRSIPRAEGGRELSADPETGPKVAAAARAILAGSTVASQAATLGITPSSLSRLLGNRLLAIHGVLGWTEYDRLRRRSPAKTWTRTGGIGAAFRCYACGGRLYLARGARPVYKCGPGRHRDLAEKGVGIAAWRLEKEIEELFLGSYGDLPQEEMRVVGDDEERARRVHAARNALESARVAMEEADGAEAEDRAYAAWRAAKNDAKLAEAMPSATRKELVPTGRTYAEAWADADDEERVRLLRWPGGPWIVGPAEWGERRVREESIEPTAADVAEWVAWSDADPAEAVAQWGE